MYVPLDYNGTMLIQPRDCHKNVIKIGDQVEILCHLNQEFYLKTGTVILLDERNYRGAFNVFVQMMGNGGGMWWCGLNLRIQI